MADITGAITTLPAEDNILTGDVTLTLAAAETYSFNLSGAFTLTVAGEALTLTGTNTHLGTTINTGGTVSVATDTAIAAEDGPIGLAGGTLEFTGTGIDLSDRAVTLTADSTINNLVDDGAKGGTVTIPGVISGNFALGITGGDLTSYLPSVIVSGVNTSTGLLTVARGNNFELNYTDQATVGWAGAIALSGDLKGRGTVSGVVTSTGGRVSPGSTVGTGLTVGGLVDDAETTYYFGYENNEAGDAVLFDTLTTTAAVTLSGTVRAVAYNDVIASTSNLIATGGLTDDTSSFVSVEFYSDDNEDVTNGSLTRTATGAVTGANYVLTLA